MPAPTRPVAAATIATDWGQAVHDFVFAPAGCRVAGSVTNIGSTEGRLDLSTATDDPGGYLTAASDELEIPTDGGGLYLIAGTVQIDETDYRVRIRVYLNGVSIVSLLEYGDGASAVAIPLPTDLYELADGDVIHVTAQRTTGSGNVEARVLRFSLLRVGYELGAP